MAKHHAMEAVTCTKCEDTHVRAVVYMSAYHWFWCEMCRTLNMRPGGFLRTPQR